MNPFGFNILSQTVDNRNALIDWITQAQPAACLVMDDVNLAAQIRTSSPQTLVIHRDSNKNEKNWHEVQSPEEWLTAHKPLAANNIVLQCFNEPSPADTASFLDWQVRLLTLATQANVRLALPAFAVGNPPDHTQIINGAYDTLLRALAGSPHYLMLHEYFKQDALAESNWLSGRFNFWLNRADVLGIQHPRIVIGEHGRDLGGGRNDGWQGQGWSEDDYFSRLVAAQSLYQEQGIPVCIYCYGHGGNDDWRSFDVEHAETLKTRLMQYGKDHPFAAGTPVFVHDGTGDSHAVAEAAAVDRTTLGDPIEGVVAAVKATFTNIRDVPSTNGNGIGKLFKGDAITYRPQPTDKIGKYRWYALEKPVVGWFADVATPQPNP